MTKQNNPTDVFMQFAALAGVWPAVTTVLTEVALKTGLSIRGGLMWLIHRIEFLTELPRTSDSEVAVSLSVRDGLVALPQLDDPGCLAELSVSQYYVTSGGNILQLPFAQHFLPPIPLAAPNLSLYFMSSPDQPTLDGTKIRCRVGYTTSPLDAKSYAEIAETWAYV